MLDSVDSRVVMNSRRRADKPSDLGLIACAELASSAPWDAGSDEEYDSRSEPDPETLIHAASEQCELFAAGIEVEGSTGIPRTHPKNEKGHLEEMAFLR